MHSAPAVTYPVGRCHIQAWLTGLLWGAGGLVCGLWLHAAGELGWPQGLALLAWTAAGAWAWQDLRRPPRGSLRWDGQQWLRQGLGYGDSVRGTVEVQLDFQQALLLAFRPAPGRAQWLWLTRTADPSHWQALRRALWSRAGHAAAPDGASSGRVA